MSNLLDAYCADKACELTASISNSTLTFTNLYLVLSNRSRLTVDSFSVFGPSTQMLQQRPPHKHELKLKG